MEQIKEPLFDMGRTVATRPVSMKIENDEDFRELVGICLYRHSVGDFGATPEEDVRANLDELNAGVLKTGGGRILSRYHTNGEPDEKEDFFPEDIYIQTLNENGSVYTMVMFCEEY